MEPQKCLYMVLLSLIILQTSCSSNKTSNRMQKFMPIDNNEKFIIITKRMSELLLTCKYTRIGTLTDSEKCLYWSPELQESATFMQIKYINLNIRTPMKKENYLRSRHPNKLEMFFVVASTTTSLHYMINRLRLSKWWNASALFVILDGNTLKTGCRHAQSFLSSSWKMDMLASTFFCFDPTEGIVMYSFNPFTNRAPLSWHRVETSDNASVDKTWNLYKRKFHRGRITCNDLDFEKTLKLDGYEFNAVGTPVPPLFFINPDKTGDERFGGFDAKILRSINHKLNSTVSANVIGRTLGWIDGSGMSHGAFSNVSASMYDYAINSQYIFNKLHTALTYPHLESGLTVITRFSGFKTAEAKIFGFMNPVFILCIALMFAMTVFVLSKTTNYTFCTASLDSLRIATNTSMERSAKRNSLRIYIVTVALLFVISNAAFQCNLAAILTKPIAKDNIDNLEQLMDSNYTIYCYRAYRPIFYHPLLIPKLVMIDSWNCTNYVLEDENAACVGDRYELVEFAITNGFYLSSNIATLATAYVVRPDWPLRDRVNLILRRLFEAGIIIRWRQETDRSVLHSWYIYNKALKSCCIRQLSMKDLAFIFLWLFLGLFVSGIAFCVEILTFNRFKHRQEMRKKGKNREGRVAHGNADVFVFVL